MSKKTDTDNDRARELARFGITVCQPGRQPRVRVLYDDDDDDETIDSESRATRRAESGYGE